MGSEGCFLGEGLGSVLYEHNTVKTPWGHPWPPRHLQCKEHCRKIAGDMSQWAGCASFKQTHTDTHIRCDYVNFSMERFWGFWRLTVQGFFFFPSWLEHRSLKHGAVSAVAVKKTKKQNKTKNEPYMESEIRYSQGLCPLIHYLHQGQTNPSIHSIKQTVWWVSQ